MNRGTKRLVLFAVLAGSLAFVIFRFGSEGWRVDGDLAATVDGTAARSDSASAPSELGPVREVEDRQRAVATPVESDEVPEAAAEIEHAERDLVVRVVDPDGQLQDGVLLSLFMERPDGRTMAIPNEFRVSGHGSRVQNLGSDDEPQPGMQGVAIWQGKHGLLRNHWGAFDENALGQIPALEVGVAMPSELDEAQLASRRVTLDFAHWPEDGIELEVDAQTVAMLEPLRVEVHFASGEPAPDVPVALFGIPLNPEFGRMSEFGQATSGPDGVALIPRGQQLQIVTFMGLLGGAESEPGDLFEFHVAPSFPITLAPRTEVPAVFGRGQTVRLDLPPVGRLRGRFVDFRGAAYGSPEFAVHCRVNWTAAAQPSNERETIETFGSSSTEPSVDFGWVGLDMEFNARAWLADGSAPGANFRRLGPLEAGEEVEFLFEFGAPYTRLAWRVLDAGGEAVANETLEYCVREAKDVSALERAQTRHWLRVESDAVGSVRWIMRPDLDPVARWFELRRSVNGMRTWGSVQLPARLPDASIPEGSSTGPVVALGTIQLGDEPLPELDQPLEREEPLLAEGHVIDDAGAPIVGATIYASASQTLAATKTDDAGHFELRTKKPKEFRLRMWHDDFVKHLSDPLQPGSMGLVVELARAGGLRLRIIGLNAMLGDTVNVSAVCNDVWAEAGRPRPRRPSHARSRVHPRA